MSERLPAIPRLRAIPFFVPGWLFLPMLWYGIPFLPRNIDENLLSLILQIPAVLSLVVLFPLLKGWVTGRQVGLYLLVPNGLVAMMWFSTLPD